jgi:hypothetical protein
MRNVGIVRSKPLALTKAFGAVGTWTVSYADDMIKNSVAAADQVAQLIVPVELGLINDGEGVGTSSIESIEVSYNVGTAALDAAVVAEIQSVAKAVDGAAPVVTTLACTVSDDVLGDTTLVDDHKINITPDASLLISGDNQLLLEISFDQAGTTTVDVTGVAVNYKPIVG